MHLSQPATAVAATALVFASGLFNAGCQVAPLPEGYSWNVRPAEDLAHSPRSGPSHRRGLDASRVDSRNAGTNRGGKAYNFASALPGTTTAAAGSFATAPGQGQAPAAPAADLSPPLAPRDLFADDPAAALFGSPAAAPSQLRVELAPTPAAGRNPGVAFHTIARGDNLWSIAQRYYGSGLRYQDLLKANPGINPEKLKLGDRLVLPGIAPAGG